MQELVALSIHLYYFWVGHFVLGHHLCLLTRSSSVCVSTFHNSPRHGVYSHSGHTLPFLVIPLYASPHLCQQEKKLASSFMVPLFDTHECLNFLEQKDGTTGLLRGSEQMILHLPVSQRKKHRERASMLLTRVSALTETKITPQRYCRYQWGAFPSTKDRN